MFEDHGEFEKIQHYIGLVDERLQCEEVAYFDGQFVGIIFTRKDDKYFKLEEELTASCKDMNSLSIKRIAVGTRQRKAAWTAESFPKDTAYPAQSLLGGPIFDNVKEVPLIEIDPFEFKECLLGLGDFPLELRHILRRIGNPMEFAVTPNRECRFEKDILFVDTQGYDYPRYKSSAMILPNE